MIGPYRLERVLGTGSFATVWLAYDDVLDREVAVKILADNWSRDNDVRRRFLTEARVLLTVESPRIVRGFHLGETPTGQPYLVMAYADRGTIGDRIEQRRREGRTFDARETIGIASEVAYALVDVHTSGHLHRDVKPSNVLIRSSSTRRSIPGLAADETIVLGDFGLARGIDLSALTLVAGSPGYVAPEQAAGLAQLDRRADLYPLGRMMLEMLTGDAGGRATTMAGAANETIDVAALVADLDQRGLGEPGHGLVDLITRLVAKNPDDRPSSADDVAAQLDSISRAFAPAGSDAPARPLTPPTAPASTPPTAEGERQLTGTQLAAEPRRGRGVLRDRRVVAGAAAVLLIALAGVILMIVRDGDGSGAGTSTTSPIILPDSTAEDTAANPATSAGNTPTTAQGGRPIATTAAGSDTAPPSVTTEPATTEPPATTAPETTETATTEPATTESSTEVLQLPEGANTGPVSTAPPDPTHQQGVILMTAVAFADALVAENPAWTGTPTDPDADGVIDFEMTGFGRTASIHIEPAAETATGGVIDIVTFEIDYS
jgi:tRNA A-37 threonylcarbamoyl transferase component Bud32